MNRTAWSFALGLVLLASFASRSNAQRATQAPTGTALRDLISEDSLTPAKAQLRDFVAELRDTLVRVQALHSSITRNLATGMTSVVVSNGYELRKRCRVGAAMAALTTDRVASMHTSDPRGDQALNAYRAGLTGLMEDLKTCQRDDSVTMAAAKPSQQNIEEVAAAAAAAVTRYDAIRDGLMTLLGINLPIKGKIR